MSWLNRAFHCRLTCYRQSVDFDIVLSLYKIVTGLWQGFVFRHLCCSVHTSKSSFECCCRGIHLPKPMMNIPPISTNLPLLNFPPFLQKNLISPYFRAIDVFCTPYFDHDAFTHHALHVLDAPALLLHDPYPPRKIQ